tara:strand:+ start:3529 stop:4884 length:1356 start_codon:yes stop_codon:yes gene_type:complete
MPSGVVDTPRDEEKWEKAKQIAAKAGRSEDYAYIMGIYKRMNPDHKFKKTAHTKVGNQMGPSRADWHKAIERVKINKKPGVRADDAATGLAVGTAAGAGASGTGALAAAVAKNPKLLAKFPRLAKAMASAGKKTPLAKAVTVGALGGAAGNVGAKKLRDSAKKEEMKAKMHKKVDALFDQRDAMMKALARRRAMARAGGMPKSANIDKAMALMKSKGMSAKDALRAVYPDWSDEKIAETAAMMGKQKMASADQFAIDHDARGRILAQSFMGELEKIAVTQKLLNPQTIRQATRAVARRGAETEKQRAAIGYWRRKVPFSKSWRADSRLVEGQAKAQKRLDRLIENQRTAALEQMGRGKAPSREAAATLKATEPSALGGSRRVAPKPKPKPTPKAKPEPAPVKPESSLNQAARLTGYGVMGGVGLYGAGKYYQNRKRKKQMEQMYGGGSGGY